MFATRPRQRLVIGLLASLLGAGPALPARGEDLAVEQWQQQRSQFDTFIQNLKPLDKHRISDVLELRVEKKYLVLRTPLNSISSEQSLRATFDGIRGLGVVAIRRDERADAFAEPMTFSLSLTDFPSPMRTATIAVTQGKEPDQLTLSKGVVTTNGAFQNVILTQQKSGLSNGSGLVQLIITEARSQGIAPDQLNLEATDFTSFVREHPAETDRYVRPLLRELGQEAVFSPDQMIAWQVFSDLWKPDANTTSRVQQLLPALNSDDYHQRDQALGHLRELGRNGAAMLIHLDRTGLTPEQNARIDRALIPYAQISMKESARLRSDPVFLLDCLYSDDISLRKAAINRLRQVIRPDLQFNIDADLEARTVGIAVLRSQVLPVHPSIGK